MTFRRVGPPEMVATGTLVLASVLVLMVPSVVVAATAIALSRPGLGLFTVGETRSTPFGYDRYEFKSRNHRRAFGVVVLVEFFLLAMLVVFAVDAYIVGA